MVTMIKSLNEQIEDLLENNASDFEISKAFKQHIGAYLNSLDNIFEQNQGKDFLVRHTKSLDTIITLMYKTILRRNFGNYLPMRSAIPIAFIALGSYGREQLCVHSDIDLMIVFEKAPGYNIDMLIEKVLYLAWDSGLKLGHRVHECSDIVTAAQEDITIRTAMMEARYICGSNFTWHETSRQINLLRHIEPKAFLLAKIEEAHQRRKKFPYSMQPNVKEGVGGMRDAQLIFWFARTIYGVNHLRELSGELFSDNSYKEYRIAIELLFRVRSALHLIEGKQQDQLRFENMPQVAKMLGFKDEKRLVTKVLEGLWRINNFSQIFIKKMFRPYLSHDIPFATLRASRIEKNFYNINNRLYTNFNRPIPNINELLDTLLSLEDKKWKFDPSVVSLMTYSHVQHPLREKTYVQIRALLSRQYSYDFFRLFYDSGILSELFVMFKKVAHLPQFDGYHHFPVDLHSIECMRALEDIKEPFIKQLYENLSEDDKLLLRIVVLLHDSGKGRKQDHSEVGVKIITPFVKKLKLSPKAVEQAGVLVRHHVLMSTVAFREDIYAEKILYKFMSSVQTAENLDLLYVLTYADINGVGEGTYTSFGAKLLYKLYMNAQEVSQQSERIDDATKRLRKEKRLKNAQTYKNLPRLIQKKILSIESNLFFFKHDPSEIVNIALQAQNVGDYTLNLQNQKTLSIEIIRRVPLNLGYLLGQLTYLDVASMDIFTLYDDIKYFKIEFFQKVDSDMLVQIEDIIHASFDMKNKTTLKQPTILASQIMLDCDHSKTYAQLNINTTNQRGLLAYIVKRFDENNINIATAKVHTTKKHARDNFLIEKQQEMCDNATKFISLLL